MCVLNIIKKTSLWDGWPVAELLDPLPKLLVRKNIVAGERNIVHSHYLTNLYRKDALKCIGDRNVKNGNCIKSTDTYSIAKATLGSLGDTLHENHHFFLVNHGLHYLH